MVFLQTGCSKEKSQEQGSKPVRKSAPVDLLRTHTDVLNFTEQYGLYASGGLYEYPTLTLDDAEWILEAAFNYAHAIQNPSEVEGLEISYEEADPLSFEVSEYEDQTTVNTTTLFGVYDQIMTQSASMQLAPSSDFEIEPIEAGNAGIRRSYASLNPPIDPFRGYLTPLPYDDYQRSICTSSNIKSQCWSGQAPYCNGGNVSNYFAWEQLTHNLRPAHIPPIWQSTGGSYFHTLTTYKIGEDPFDDLEYLGPTGQDYSLDVYGASPLTVNSLSFADGHWQQCISNSQMQDFRSGMDGIIADHIALTPNSEVSYLAVEPHTDGFYDDGTGTIVHQKWAYHTFVLTVGIKNP